MNIQIVNERDEIISHKERSEMSTEDICRVAGLLIRNAEGDILICQRAATKRVSPGKWELGVGGTVEEGETYESNIEKEAREELGLTGLHIHKSFKEFNEPPLPYFCQWFSTTINLKIEDLTLQEEEVVGARWIPEQDLMRELSELPGKYVLAAYRRKDGNFPA